MQFPVVLLPRCLRQATDFFPADFLFQTFAQPVLLYQGQPVGSVTAVPAEVDEIARHDWDPIFDGNVQDLQVQGLEGSGDSFAKADVAADVQLQRGRELSLSQLFRECPRIVLHQQPQQ